MKSPNERLIDLVEKQAERIADLEEKVEALTPKEPEQTPVPEKPWSEMTPDEKVTYTASKYSG